MGIPESNFCRRFIFETKLKNFEIHNFLKSQEDTRATFIKCGTP